jgi:hypothetical protein
VLDEALAPVDRDVFRRQVHYDGLIQPGAVVRSTEQTVQPAPSQK